MLIVTGSVLVQDGRMDEALALSQEHVRRSRTEPGCMEHGVYVDCENAARLMFVERWASSEALQAHFAVPASRAFAKALGGLATATPSMQVYEATQTR